MLKGLIAVVCLLAAGYCFYTFQTTPNASQVYVIGGIAFAVLMAVFGVMFLSGRVNKSEDIHITE